MTRPCFLIVDREFPASISTRKLVVETAKFNVITAYSGAEALDTVKRFPALNGIVLDAGISDMPCQSVVELAKKLQPKLPVIVVAVPGARPCQGADHTIDSFDPGELLRILRSLDPASAHQIIVHDVELSREEEGE
jgi:DNA-binding response OmpR family regulator